MDKKNLTMLTDFYEITMANGYLESGMEDQIAYFDMFFRKIPDKGGFAIMAGLEQVIEYLADLKFTDEDIEYLRKKGKEFWEENILKKVAPSPVGLKIETEQKIVIEKLSNNEDN